MTHMPGTLALVRGPLQCQVAARCAFARVRRGRLETFQQPWNEILYLPRERKTTSTTWIDTRQCKLIHGSIKRPLRGVCIPARRSAQPVRSSSRTAWSDKSDMRAMLAMSTSSAPPPGCTCTACARGGGTVSVRAWQGSAAAAGAGKFLETFLLGLGHKLGGGVGGGATRFRDDRVVGYERGFTARTASLLLSCCCRIFCTLAHKSICAAKFRFLIAKSTRCASSTMLPCVLLALQ